jgi:hypothetical protein
MLEWRANSTKGYAKELCDKYGQDKNFSTWVRDDLQKYKEEFTEFLLPRLTIDTFNTVFHFVKDDIDYERTKNETEFKQGWFLIQSIFLSLIPMLARLYIRESNEGTHAAYVPQVDQKSTDNQDLNMRKEIKEAFRGWGHMKDLDNCTLDSFAFQSGDLQAPVNPILLEMDLAQKTFRTPGPPPPTSKETQGSSSFPTSVQFTSGSPTPHGPGSDDGDGGSHDENRGSGNMDATFGQTLPKPWPV